jgi:Leucine-rich repeat (LRR) protein
LSGVIPSQIGQLQGATILLKENRFHNSSASAPLSLCTLLSVEEFDLADDVTLCPPERNALSDFYDSAKGAEWTDRSNWTHEYASYCDWKGVTCDNDMKHVKNLSLSNNGLSGRLSESIGNLTFIEVLDLSDNDIKVTSICSIYNDYFPSWLTLTN